jgi:hypothetical protein
MSDDLVKRLRDDSGDWLTDLAADRIEELQAKLTQAEDFVLRTLRYAGNNGDDFLADKARAALAELKGETDETKR